MKKYLNKIFLVLFGVFVLVGCEGMGLYVISTAGTASGTYLTEKYLLDKDAGQIFQLKDGRWITNKGIILKSDDPRILQLEK
jgi:hypothetical protein